MITQTVALGIDFIALLVITSASIAVLGQLCMALLRRAVSAERIEQVRVDLGHSLVLGLEFMIGADILRTAVAPSWSSIGQLGAIVLLRTLLDYFLERELYTSRTRSTRQPPSDDMSR